MICELWFSTPIWSGKFINISDQDYNNAVNYCILLSTRSPGRIKSNVGGWQSEELYYHNLIKTPLQIFIEQIKPAVGEALYDLGITQELKLNNIWININSNNDENKIHHHAGSSISGVFYLTSNNSDIVFYRNRDISDVHLAWLKSNRNTMLSFPMAKYTPTRGQYLIFPSWLEHSVEPNKSIEKRISVSFNVAFVDD